MMGDVFNKMCKIAEQLKDKPLEAALRKSRLFYIERGEARRKNTKTLIEYINNNLPLMPFDTCCIESDNMVVNDYNAPGCIVIEAIDNVKEKMLSYSFRYWICIVLPDDNQATSIISGVFYIYENMVKNFQEVFGDIAGNLAFNMKASVDGKIIIANKDYPAIKVDLDDKTTGDVKLYKQDATDTLSTWFYLFTSIVNTEKSFILEETNVNTKNKEKKIPRSHQRSTYTVLSPAAIRRKLGINSYHNVDGKRIEPHERRRHIRRLRTESGYKYNRDIIIEATWIGESEKQIGNKKYKIRLDL